MLLEPPLKSVFWRAGALCFLKIRPLLGASGWTSKITPHFWIHRPRKAKSCQHLGVWVTPLEYIKDGHKSLQDQGSCHHMWIFQWNATHPLLGHTSIKHKVLVSTTFLLALPLSPIPWQEPVWESRLNGIFKSSAKEGKKRECKRFLLSSFSCQLQLFCSRCCMLLFSLSSYSLKIQPTSFGVWLHVFLLLVFCLRRWASISCLKTSIPSWPWEASFMALDCMHILYCSGVSSSRQRFSCQRWKRPRTGVLTTIRLLWRYLR